MAHEIRIVPQPRNNIIVTQIPGVGPPAPPVDEELLAEIVDAAVGPAVDAAIEEHVNDTTPHPVYDDIHSLVLIFNNHLL